MSLYNQYRPQSLNQIKGNISTITALQSKIVEENLPHSILLSGPYGCGKTTIARILANEVNCSEFDLIEINCADDTGIDPIRRIISNMKLKPMKGKSRVYILDEVHRLTSIAQSALLKPLEDTPHHVYFFLCTTDPQKILQTVQSRCSSFPVEPLTEEQLCKIMKVICLKEKKKVSDKILEQIAQDSLGHPRDALVILESIIDLDQKEMEESARKKAEQTNAVIDLCRALSKKQVWKEITKIINGIQEDPETIRRSILSYCDSILSKTDDAWAYLLIDCLKEPLFHTGKAGLRAGCYEALDAIKERR